MIKKTKILNFLCLAMMLASTTADALINKMVVLKKDINGAAHYIYCMGDKHLEKQIARLEGLSLKISANGKINSKPVQKANAVIKKSQTVLARYLTPLTISQGKTFADYVGQLEKDTYALINEDMFEYDGDNKAIKKNIRGNKKFRDLWGIGGKGFLPYTTELFEKNNWPVINAECRHFWADPTVNTNMHLCGSLYGDTVNSICYEISQSTAPEIFKAHSNNSLEINRKDAAIWLASPDKRSSGFAELLDARIPQLVWEQQHKKHIFLVLGSVHIERFIPLLQKFGYLIVLSKDGHSGTYEAEEQELKKRMYNLEEPIKETDLQFFNNIFLNLETIFAECLEQQGKQTQESKQTEYASNSNAKVTRTTHSTVNGPMLAHGIINNYFGENTPVTSVKK